MIKNGLNLSFLKYLQQEQKAKPNFNTQHSKG